MENSCIFMENIKHQPRSPVCSSSAECHGGETLEPPRFLSPPALLVHESAAPHFSLPSARPALFCPAPSSAPLPEGRGGPAKVHMSQHKYTDAQTASTRKTVLLTCPTTPAPKDSSADKVGSCKATASSSTQMLMHEPAFQTWPLES